MMANDFVRWELASESKLASRSVGLPLLSKASNNIAAAGWHNATD